MFLRGVKGRLQPDMAKAFEYSEKACHMGSVPACYNLSRMYERGDGTEKDAKKAELYGKRAEAIFKVLKSQGEETAAAYKEFDPTKKPDSGF